MKADIFLTGLVSGLTILLGVITADWLKRLRDRISYTRRVTGDISLSHMKFVEDLKNHLVKGAGFESASKRSEEEKERIEVLTLLHKELRDLSEIPRWPQRNAKQIRVAAANYRSSIFANLEHCATYQVFLHQDDADELDRLELVFLRATRSTRAFENTTNHVLEKTAELKRQMLSREAANTITK
jgi:hypothetical protein